MSLQPLPRSGFAMRGYRNLFSFILSIILDIFSQGFIKIVCGMIFLSNFIRSSYLLVHENQLNNIQGLIFEKKNKLQALAAK
jgi:hypothetical protein